MLYRLKFGAVVVFVSASPLRLLHSPTNWRLSTRHTSISHNTPKMSNLSALLSALLLCAGPTLPSGAGVRTATAFVPPSAVVPSASSSPAILVQPSTSLSAGGFEWEDPTDQFDQGVENPFKNPEILIAKDGSAVEGEEGMKIDPARLLGPRLQGSNLYFVGMMGSGKSAVGDIVARSEYE